MDLALIPLCVCVLKCLFRKCVVNRPHIFLTSARFIEPALLSHSQSLQKRDFTISYLGLGFSLFAHVNFCCLAAIYTYQYADQPCLVSIHICMRTSVVMRLRGAFPSRVRVCVKFVVRNSACSEILLGGSSITAWVPAPHALAFAITCESLLMLPLAAISN